jgi:glycosyltransferase involved in cell wall biosynthesis
LRQLADKLGIASRVEFLGSVDNPEAYMREADLLLMPSRFEGFGLAALEAQLAGLPVVASPAVSPEVVVSDGVEFVPLEVSSWVTAVQNWRVRSEPVHLDPDKLAKFDIRLAVKDYCNLLNLP